MATIGQVPKGTSGRNTSQQVADTLSTDGVYSVVRHPLYLGNFLMCMGVSMMPHQYLLVWIIFVFHSVGEFKAGGSVASCFGSGETMTRLMLVLFACLAGATAGVCAQIVSIHGIMVAAASNEPLTGALVALSAKSDWNGRFDLPFVLPGAYHLVVSYPGFAPDSLSLVVDGTAPVH